MVTGLAFPCRALFFKGKFQNKAIFVPTKTAKMRPIGSTNGGKLQKSETIKFRISPELLAELDKHLKGRTRTEFITEAIKNRILFTVFDFREVNKDVLDNS